MKPRWVDVTKELLTLCLDTYPIKKAITP